MTPGKHIALEGLAPNHTELLRRLHAELVAVHVPVKLLATSWDSTDVTTQTVAAILEDARYPKSLRTHSLLSDSTLAAQHEAIRKELDNGVNCLTGRSALTSLVGDYYGLGVANDYQLVSNVIDFAAVGKAADLTIVLDAPVTDLITLSASELYLPADTTPNAALLERMRAGYLWEAKQHGLPVIAVDGDTNRTFDQIWQLVADFLGIDTAPRPAGEPHSVAEILAANPPQQSQNPERSKSFAGAFGQSTPEGTLETEETTSVHTQPISVLTSAYLQADHLATSHDFADRYDQKDEAGHYRYYLPAELKGKVRSQYIRTMNQLFDTYSEMSASLTAYLASSSLSEATAYDVLRSVLPLAATGTLELLPTQPAKQAGLPAALPETQELAKELPGHIVSVDDQKLTELAMDLLPPNFTAEDEAIKLLDFQPRNELDLAADVLFEHTDLPTKQLRQIASSWTYEQKADALAIYCKAAPGAALEAAQYTFDIVAPFTALYDLLTQPASPHGVRWQLATPRLGYAMPRLVEEAGLSDQYEECFDRSLELFSALHEAKGMQLAQYAVLQGHKLRWTCSLNALEAIELMRTIPSLQRESGELNVLQQVFEKISEVHPLLAETMATER